MHILTSHLMNSLDPLHGNLPNVKTTSSTSIMHLHRQGCIMEQTTRSINSDGRSGRPVTEPAYTTVSQEQDSDHRKYSWETPRTLIVSVHDPVTHMSQTTSIHTLRLQAAHRDYGIRQTSDSYLVNDYGSDSYADSSDEEEETTLSFKDFKPFMTMLELKMIVDIYYRYKTCKKLYRRYIMSRLCQCLHYRYKSNLCAAGTCAFRALQRH